MPGRKGAERQPASPFIPKSTGEVEADRAEGEARMDRKLAERSDDEDTEWREVDREEPAGEVEPPVPKDRGGDIDPRPQSAGDRPREPVRPELDRKRYPTRTSLHELRGERERGRIEIGERRYRDQTEDEEDRQPFHGVRIPGLGRVTNR